MKIKRYLIWVISAISILPSCTEKNYYAEPNLTPTGTVVTNIPSQILSFDNAKLIGPGSVLKLRLNRTNSKVEEFDVKFDGTYEMNGERLIFCTANSSFIVGEGDSGSPLLTKDGKVIGALCYGFDFAPNQFAARAIEDLISSDTTISKTKSVKANSNLFKDLGLVNFIIGPDATNFERYNDKNSPAFFKSIQYISNETLKLKSTNMVNASAIPGNSIAVTIVSGDIYTVGAIGTLSHYNSNNKIVAFGHSFGISPLGARTTIANMVTMINSAYISYKIALPTNNIVGSMVTDTENGIVIDPSSTPKEFSHKTNLTLSGKIAKALGDSIYAEHQISNFNDPYYEHRYSASIPASIIYNKIILKGFLSLQANCVLNVTLLDGSKLNYNFSDISTDGWLDYDIYYDIRTYLSNYFYEHEFVNIKDFSLKVQIDEYNNN